MNVVLLVVLSFAGYLLAYHSYGRFLARKIFKLRQDAVTPAEAHADGIDFVPTKKGIIFGHHYTSIAGTGPIVGPAIGVIWGWVPALLWIFLGSIFMGAVHDLGAVVISMRHEGKSVAECAARFLGPRLRCAFFLLIFLLLLIVIAVFGIVMAAVFSKFPQSVFPIWMEIPIALALGWGIYRRGMRVVPLTAAAVFLMYVTVVAGHFIPLHMPANWPIPPTGLWVIVLLAYAFIASMMPVTALLQPRDYMNAWQLFIAMGLLFMGIVAAGFQGSLAFVAPPFQAAPAGAPPMVPFLFITIACGAISGFHALVGSGTTSKQVARETDAQFIGYGAMLMEGALAILVLVAVSAGIGMAYQTADGNILTGVAAWRHHYAAWTGLEGLTAVVVGSANMMASIGIPSDLGIVIMGVFIASFAGTTLDTATRIQRYVISEMTAGTPMRFMANRGMATTAAVLTAAGLAFATGADGKGALKLWPMFGAANQLLAALVLMLITGYLARKGKWAYLLTGIPCLFMLGITLWAVTLEELKFVRQGAGLLAVINALVFLLAIWIAIEGVIAILASRRKGIV